MSLYKGNDTIIVLTNMFEDFINRKMISVATLVKGLQNSADRKKLGIRPEHIEIHKVEDPIYVDLVQLFTVAKMSPEYVLNKSVMSLVVRYLRLHWGTRENLWQYANYIAKYIIPKHGIDELRAVGYNKFADEIVRMDPDHCRDDAPTLQFVFK